MNGNAERNSPGKWTDMSSSERNSWLKAAVRPLRPLIREVFTASLFVNLLGLATPIFVLQIYDRVVAQSGLTTLQGLVIGMAVVIVFDFAIRQSRGALLREGAVKLDIAIGGQLFDKVLRLPLRTLEQRPSAFWQALFRDVDQVRTVLSGSTAVICADLPFAVLGLILISVIAPSLGWVLGGIIPLFILLAWRSGSSNSNAETKERRASIRRDSMVTEMIGARTTVKAVGGRDFLRGLWERRHAETIKQSVDRGALTTRHQNLGHALHISTLVIMTSVGAIGILQQDLTIGSLVAANMLSMRVIAPLNQLIGHFRSFTALRQSIDRLDQLFDMEEDIQEQSVALARPEGRLTLDKVIFRYAREDQNNAIEGVNAGFGPGGLNALVGANGSGKSTLLKLMRGLYPPLSGRVLIDDGDIAQFSEGELNAWIGYVPQSCRLIAGSIKANIVMGYPDASDEQIVAAAKSAGVHKEILDLPGGYASSVGENGDMLSGGMRQRLSIARALVGTRPILLLDEPTSDLDPRAEQELVTTLKDLSQSQTIIVSTHSMTLLEACDHILVLEAGRIKGGGPAFEVLSHLQAAAAEFDANQNAKKSSGKATGKRS